MKYETPKLTVLTPAINAIQGLKSTSGIDSPGMEHDATAAYQDWE